MTELDLNINSDHPSRQRVGLQVRAVPDAALGGGAIYSFRNEGGSPDHKARIQAAAKAAGLSSSEFLARMIEAL